MGDIAHVVGGGTPKTKDSSNYEGGTVPWITPADLSGYTGKYISHGARLITEKGLKTSSARMMPAGTVLFTSRAPVGYVAIASNDVCTNQGFKSFVLKSKDIFPDYVYWWLKGSKDLAESYASGTTFLELSGANAKQLPIPIAPPEQQKRIVAEIEKQFSRLDEAVTNLKRVKANLKCYKAAVLKAAVEGHLVETEAELAAQGRTNVAGGTMPGATARREGRDYETGTQLLQRILKNRRSRWKGKGKYKEPAEPDTTDLTELPEGWVWATVDQLAAPEPNSITDGPFGSNLKTEHYQESGPRVIRLQNIKDGEFADEYAHISTAHFERLRKHEIQAGDLVIATLGDSPPRACIIPSFVGPAIVKADCIRFKPHSALTPAYLNAALNCQPTRQRVKNLLHGVGRPRLSLREIRAIALPVPPETEQHRIVAELDRHLSLVHEVEAQLDANLKRAERLRQLILGRTFSGELVIVVDAPSKVAV